MKRLELDFIEEKEGLIIGYDLSTGRDKSVRVKIHMEGDKMVIDEIVEITTVSDLDDNRRNQ